MSADKLLQTSIERDKWARDAMEQRAKVEQLAAQLATARAEALRLREAAQLAPAAKTQHGANCSVYDWPGSDNPMHRRCDCGFDVAAKPTDPEVSKRVADAMERSKALVSDALKLGRSMAGADPSLAGVVIGAAKPTPDAKCPTCEGRCFIRWLDEPPSAPAKFIKCGDCSGTGLRR